MKLTKAEIEFLSAWAREEWEVECYLKPAHRLQVEHKVVGILFVNLIKVWARAEGKADQDIVEAANNSNPAWPWSSADAWRIRLKEAEKEIHEPVGVS
jgi:hypothetical protein